MKTIVLIDDDADDLETLVQALHVVDRGTHCLCYTHPVKAIKQLTYRNLPVVDCIIVDMFMPGLTGRECLDAIRNIPAFHQTDVLMMSTIFQEGEAEAMCRKGACAACLKPYSWEGFLNMASTILKKSYHSRGALVFE